MLRLKIKDDQYSLSYFGFFFAILSSLLLFDFLFLAEEETVSLVNSDLELEGEEVEPTMITSFLEPSTTIKSAASASVKILNHSKETVYKYM